MKIILHSIEKANWTWNGNAILTQEMLDGKMDEVAYKDKIRIYENLNTYANKAIETFENLYQRNPNVKVYFSFPHIECTEIAYYYDNVFEELYNYIKAQVINSSNGLSKWNTNVEGFYYGTEIFDFPYTQFNTNNKVDFDNTIVKNMKFISDIVHKDGKRMVWIPVIAGDEIADTRIEKIGYIANATNIFDYVIIQSTYPFSDVRYSGNTSSITRTQENVYIIAKSVEENAVYKKGISEIVTPKTSNTRIGFELEFALKDTEWSSNSMLKYDESVYVLKSKFGSINNVAFVFYIGGPKEIKEYSDENEKGILLKVQEQLMNN